MIQQRGALMSPQGKPIIGTLENLRGRADIVPGSAIRDDLGGIEFEYEGETHIFWDEQCTVTHDDERVFVDEEGNEFVESELRLESEGDAQRPGTDAAAEAPYSPVVIAMTIEGGVIHAVQGIPKGIVIRVVDLDIESVAPERITPMANGERAYVSEWNSEDAP